MYLRFACSANNSSTCESCPVLIDISKFYIIVVPNLGDSLGTLLVKLGQSSINVSHSTDYLTFGTMSLDSFCHTHFIGKFDC